LPSENPPGAFSVRRTENPVPIDMAWARLEC
jgi:hypothetical protein